MLLVAAEARNVLHVEQLSEAGIEGTEREHDNVT